LNSKGPPVSFAIGISLLGVLYLGTGGMLRSVAMPAFFALAAIEMR
jgi:hypothetical protein